MSYSDKLLDPRWQRKRLHIFERDNWTCQNCGSTDVTLHVHHLMYERGGEPWDVEDGCLISLCALCHKWETKLRKRHFGYVMNGLNSNPIDSGDLEMLSLIIENVFGLYKEERKTILREFLDISHKRTLPHYDDDDYIPQAHIEMSKY